MNPKQQFGLTKVPFHYFPMTVLAEASVGMMEGALKYGAHNYRDTEIFASTYIDAALRHVLSFWEGEDNDAEACGLNHAVKAIDSLAVMRDAQICGKLIDDRPLRPPPEWLRGLMKTVKDLQDKYPNPKAPFIEAARAAKPISSTWIEGVPYTGGDCV